MRKHLGVAVRPEHVAVAQELCAHLVVVVELAVLDRPDVTCLVGQRLMPSLDVDDAQTSNAERDAVLLKDPAVVGSPVRHQIRHPVEAFRLDNGTRLAPHLNDSADPAHDENQDSRVCRRDQYRLVGDPPPDLMSTGRSPINRV
jgi:hypothetical protein